MKAREVIKRDHSVRFASNGGEPKYFAFFKGKCLPNHTPLIGDDILKKGDYVLDGKSHEQEGKWTLVCGGYSGYDARSFRAACRPNKGANK